MTNTRLNKGDIYRVLKVGFIEESDDSEWNLYCDTDSSYNKVPLPFNKFEDTKKTVKFTADISRHFNQEYLKVYDNTVIKHGGGNPKYNLMFFKSEIVAYRGFFNGKKYYGLAKMWDEGTFFDTPKVKKTGGQIIKSDSSKIVLDLLTEVYDVLLLDFEIKDVRILYNKIFKDIHDKYLKRTRLAVKEYNISEFGIPKKWGSSATKTIPSQVKGAMFFNYLINDNIRPGDSLIMCQIKINPAKLRIYYSNDTKEKTKYMINEHELSSKLKYISLPSDITDKEIIELLTIFKALDIEFDMQTIIEFNVLKKLDQFIKLFDEKVQLECGKYNHQI